MNLRFRTGFLVLIGTVCALTIASGGCASSSTPNGADSGAAVDASSKEAAACLRNGADCGGDPTICCSGDCAQIVGETTGHCK
jgi:hypothetical protein